MIRFSTKLKGRPGIDRPIRVLHCPSNIGGGPQSVASAQRELGLESISLVFQKNQFDFLSDKVIFRKKHGVFCRYFQVLKLILKVPFEFDIIHYNSGSPLLPLLNPATLRFKEKSVWRLLSPLYHALLPLLDVALFHALGKGIAFTYNGTDARQKDYCLANHEITFVGDVDFHTAESDDRKRRQIAKFAHYADRIYAVSPDLLNMLPPAELLPVPRDMRQWVPLYPEPRERPRVMHAPSERGVKGTRLLLAAAERLRHEGVPFDLELIENLPHAEAQRRYREADLMVDQLLLGWYGGFAVEAMALGKPVIAYLRESDLQFLPPAMRAELPVIEATPTTIYSVLKEWLTDRRHELPERGRAGRIYVERWHDARVIAKRLVADYRTILRERESRRGQG